MLQYLTMIKPMRLVSPLAVATAVASLAAPVAAQAATKTPAGAERPVTRAEAIVQADGITNRVVDKLWAESDRYWHDGDYNRVVALLRLCVEADPSFIDAYANAAWLLWSMGDTPAADRMLKDGVAKNPGKYDLYYELGWHLFNTKRYTEALPYLQSAVKQGQPPARVWMTLGHCYTRLGQLDKAEATFQTVVTKFPDWPSGPTNLKRIQELRRARQREG